MKEGSRVCPAEISPSMFELCAALHGGPGLVFESVSSVR